MHHGLESRVRALEQGAPKETERPTSLLPKWLLEEWRPRGLRWDSASKIDWESLRPITGCGRSSVARPVMP
jgi:hypothetical protein